MGVRSQLPKYFKVENLQNPWVPNRDFTGVRSTPHSHSHKGARTARFEAHAQRHLDAHRRRCELVLQKLSRLRGGMADLRSLFVGLPALLLIWNVSRGVTLSANRRNNQERCGFKVKKKPQYNCWCRNLLPVSRAPVQVSAHFSMCSLSYVFFT